MSLITYDVAKSFRVQRVYSPNEGGGIDSFELDWENDGAYKNGPYHMEIGIKGLFLAQRGAGVFCSLRDCAEVIEQEAERQADICQHCEDLKRAAKGRAT